ncbi:MAG: DNA mismatch repair protein MutS [Flavobacteriaceae bacterium]|nr:DNA mismatch repair protein MutS [Flavobacteriaceae bacterium]
MNLPQEFYQEQKQFFKKELSLINRKLFRLSMIRLAVFLVIVFFLWFFFGNIKTLAPALIVGVALFFYLVSMYSDLKLLKQKTQQLIQINNTEINVLNGDLSELDFGDEFKDPTHFYSYDIDLFGKGSFFQYLNRTTIKTGKEKLASIFTSNTIEGIKTKQEAIKELADKPKWRQQFSATGSLIKVDASIKIIVNWLHQHSFFTPKSMKVLPNIFGGISLGLLSLSYLDLIPNLVIVTWFFIGLGITGIYIKKINNLYLHANKAKETFKQYHQLLAFIETETFTSEILKQKQEEIKTETKKASEIFLEFSKILDAFDQRNNMIIGIFANGFALRDIHHSYKIEQWINTYSEKVESWFKVIAFFDAKNSLANFKFNHPEFSFPETTTKKTTIKAEDLGHPLLSKEKRVTSSVTINTEEFFIITGANMAGKSTFLRTVSLSIVMGNIGLPVCASSFKYAPIKLITSMRTSDNLSEDESYFFSELKRLKFIVDEISKDNYFIILDEILKGTNSTDKAIGSRKFVQKLVASHSTGIIATHDLSLCEITNELPEVKNYYFDAEIINDELYFDYKLKEGICKNMNASFLLKKMEIV